MRKMLLSLCALVSFWFVVGPAIAQNQALRKYTPGPKPDSLGTGYYVVDSDDPISSEYWRPRYNFVDTTFQAYTWHRILPGPNSFLPPRPGTPNPVYWRMFGSDTTDNTFAGPIPIGFTFNYYNQNYDSLYLSSNGFIGFGTFARATGLDGPAFTMNPAAGGNGCMPNGSMPKAIAAFLMTDGEMVRTNFDSSKAFYRTNLSNDSFYLTFYNYYHKSGGSTNNTIHKFRADIQIVITRQDSSVTFQYRKFYGVVTIGLTAYSAENIFRIGCMPNPCGSNAGVIAIQSDNQIGGTSYMCGTQFTSAGNVADLHSGLAVKFRRWTNICQVDTIVYPPRNFEMLIGDSLIPIATYGNVSPKVQTFYTVFRIRNARTGLIVYQARDSVANLAFNKTARVIFPAWRTFPQFDEQVGTMFLEAIASPFKNVDQFIGDYWPCDDTLRQVMFVIKRLDNFSDFNNNFSSPVLIPGTIPDALKWVNINASVVDGDVFTYSPPPPRGKQGDPAGVTLNSPVIMMDRRDNSGLEYSRCAFGGVGALVGSGGTGDSILSFPINIQNVPHAVLGFSFERAGKKTYPRWYDLGTVVGPERTITAPDPTSIYRCGDSLEIEYAAPQQVTNVTSWKEFWSMDGGKDFNFSRVYLSVDSPYTTQNFRFRVRLKAKNDFEPGNPSDDYDEWYVDNFVVVSPLKPEVEVSFARLSTDWPYEKVPASQAVSVPIEVSISNNGGLVGSSFGLAVIINVKGFQMQPGLYYGVYAKLITIPVLAPGKSSLVTAPKWNARQAGPGQYSLSAFLLPKGYDAESQNDSTYYDFSMLFDSSYVYDNGVNDAPGFFQLPGIGVKMQETNPANPVGGSGTNGTGSGSIASKFIVYQRDTLLGAQLWFGSFNQSPDAIRVVIYRSQGAVPGDTISGGCASFNTVRSSPWDGWSLYNFPCGPIILDPGEYWMGVSQLGETGMELGVCAYKSSCDWIVYDPSPNLNHVFAVNYPQMIDRFAYENTALSNSWYPFYFPAGIGKAGFSYYEANSAYGKSSINCGKNYNYFHAQGSWIPLIREYFGNRTFGPPVYETLYVAVELANFTGKYSGDHVALSWTTASEKNNAGFRVERTEKGLNAWATINDDAFVAGHGTTADVHHYAMDDRDVKQGTTYQYRLKQSDNDGTVNRSNIVEVTTPPADYMLTQNYPNPFAGSTKIAFSTPTTGYVTVRVYDMLGKEIKTLVAGSVSAESNVVEWDGTNNDGAQVSSGSYVYKMEANGRTITRNLSLAR